MKYLIYFYAAFLLSTLLIPLNIKLGKRLGIVDKVNERKIHTGEIPRTGGIAIALATFAPLVAGMHFNPAAQGFLVGGLFLMVFGIWDDMKELSYKIKFIGQVGAAVLFFQVSGLQVTTFGELIPGFVCELGILSLPVSVVFFVAVINIINLSDGLDGLAGGLSLFILLSLIFLAFSQDRTLGMIIAISLAGALIGFLRYNIHPAIVFMGDTGSQFLGFSIAVLLVTITQDNSIYSPVLPLFLLGTPIIDTGLVMYERVRAGHSPFKPDTNHLHHKLLRAGMNQEQAVVAIYCMHVCLILTGIVARYTPDYWVLIMYILVIALVFVLRWVTLSKHFGREEVQVVVERIASRFLVVGGHSLSRNHISRLCWSVFFILFALHMLFVAYLTKTSGPVSPYVFAGLLLLLLLVGIFSKKYYDLLLYSSISVFLLYHVGSSLGSDPVLFEILNVDRFIQLLFWGLTGCYFGCLILTPERVPLNTIDYIMIGLTVIISVMPFQNEQYLVLSSFAVKVIMLGLMMNLIFSRIDRNRRYATVLFVVGAFETLILASLR